MPVPSIFYAGAIPHLLVILINDSTRANKNRICIKSNFFN